MHDDRLRLIFTCCHPALARRGAGRADAAHAGRPGDRGDRARVPGAGADDGAAAGARQVEDPRRGHSLPRARRRGAARRGSTPCWRSSTSSSTRATPPRSGDALVRARAVRRGDPARAAAGRAGRRREPEARALLALMLLTDARRDARVDAGGDVVLLEDQDRARWDRARDRRGAGAGRGGAARRAARARTRCRRRSPAFTRARRAPPTPTGARSPRCTRCCAARTRRRSSR